MFLGPVLADQTDWATVFAGTPQSYTPRATPYTGAELWYCSPGVGVDNSCSVANIFSGGIPSGTTIPNPIINGSITGTGLPLFLAAPGNIGATTPGAGTFTAGSFTSIVNTGLTTEATTEIGVTGLVGTGLVDNSTALQNALNAAVASAPGVGKIKLPCGKFLFNTALAVSVPAGTSLDFEGDALCTKLIPGNAVTGDVIKVTLADNTASATFRHFWLVASTAGTQNGIHIQTTTAALFGYSKTNEISDVFIVGSDYPGAAGLTTNYFGIGIFQDGTSNLDIINAFVSGGGCTLSGGKQLCNGIDLKIQGITGSSLNAVVTNVFGSSFNSALNGVLYGDWYQGLNISGSNITGVQYGIQTLGTYAGNPDQLTISNSQISYYQTGVNVQITSGILNSLNITGTYFLDLASTEFGLTLMGIRNITVTGNNFYSLSPTGTVAVNVQGVTTGTVSGNQANGFTNAYTLTGTNGVIIADNQGASNTADYAVAGGASGIIHDPYKRTTASLFACIAGTVGSTSTVTDASAPSYLANVVGGGPWTAPVICNANGTAWVTY